MQEDVFAELIEQVVADQNGAPLENLLNNIRAPSPPLQTLEELTRALQIEEFHDHCRKALEAFDSNMPAATVKVYCELFYKCVETIRINQS